MRQKIYRIVEILTWILVLISLIVMVLVVMVNKVSGITYLLAYTTGLLISILIIKRIIS